MSYWRFAAMIFTSTVVMFGLMYLNTYALDHVTYSQTRTWMAVVMGAVMSVIMMAFMWSMYKGTTTKLLVLAGAALFGMILLGVNRSQAVIDDAAFMKRYRELPFAVPDARDGGVDRGWPRHGQHPVDPGRAYRRAPRPGYPPAFRIPRWTSARRDAYRTRRSPGTDRRRAR